MTSEYTFDHYTGRVKVSKTQLKKFKVTDKNRDMYEILLQAVGCWLWCEDVESYITELTNQELLFQAVRRLRR